MATDGITLGRRLGRATTGLFARLGIIPNRIELGERDCHCHVIPGVDDGSRSLEESLAMLRSLAAAGVKTVVATPHIHRGRFDNEPEDLRRRFAALERARDDACIDIGLALGAEYWLDGSLLPCIATRRLLAFGAERYVLLETTTGPHLPPQLFDVVHALVDAGYSPLCAHVERYPYLRGDEGREILEDLRVAGARFQVNRSAGRANIPGRGVRGRFIARLCERGWIDEVGSDLHRPPR